MTLDFFPKIFRPKFYTRGNIMTTYAVISVNEEIINFTSQEISDMETNESWKVWAVYYEACKRHYKENIQLPKDDLSEKGVMHFENILSAEDVLELKTQWEQDFKILKLARNEKGIEPVVTKKNKEYSVQTYTIKPQNVPTISKIIGKTLNYKVTKSLENYFQSYFSIHHALFSEASPDPEPITSFRWHRDGGPQTQTHVMIYLDDAEETGGRTEFLSYQDTDKAIDAGYHPIITERVRDITEICPDLTVIRPKPKAGDILIFNASRVYHCGIHPTKKTRKVMTLVLQPDFLPWHQVSGITGIFSHPVGTDLRAHDPFTRYYKLIHEND